MLYIVIIAFIGTVAGFLFSIVQDWENNAGFLIVCFLITTVGSLIIAFFDDVCDMFEKKVVSTTKKETKKLIYPLDMSAQKPHKYFIIPRKDNAYHLYVKTKTGFEQTKYDIDETKLKQCNEQYPEACVVKMVTTTTYQIVPRYKKFLYYGIVFLCSANQPEETKEKTTYTLYVPQNTIIQ